MEMEHQIRIGENLQRLFAKALAPLVEGLIVLRAELRTEKAWQVADRLRDRLVAGGIELHDTPGGTTWTPRA